jgi:hypothetical protein
MRLALLLTGVALVAGCGSDPVATASPSAPNATTSTMPQFTEVPETEAPMASTTRTTTTIGATTAPSTTASSTTGTAAVTTTGAPAGETTTNVPTSTTTKPTTTISPTTPSSSPTGGLLLRGDGLGIVAFGTPTEEALDTLEYRLGPPNRSSDWFYRYWSWDDLGLTVAFDDDDFYRDDGVEHLVGWGVWGEANVLQTSGGIGIGASYDELVVAHPERVAEPAHDDECMPVWYVWLQDPGPEVDRWILVEFDGDPVRGGRIRHLRAGAGEGC